MNELMISNSACSSHLRRSQCNFQAICNDCPCDDITVWRIIEMERARRRQQVRDQQQQAENEMQ